MARLYSDQEEEIVRRMLLDKIKRMKPRPSQRAYAALYDIDKSWLSAFIKNNANIHLPGKYFDNLAKSLGTDADGLIDIMHRGTALEVPAREEGPGQWITDPKLIGILYFVDLHGVDNVLEMLKSAYGQGGEHTRDPNGTRLVGRTVAEKRGEKKEDDDRKTPKRQG